MMSAMAGEPPATPFRPWMRRWLLAAGVYNLIWGAGVVLAPDAPLALFGVEPLVGTGRAIWQCLGMVIGVYGIGYLAASIDPVRHWPIVLVGFLGKIFGPIGFVWCAARGEIDWRFGLTIPTNDLLWWIPFFLILRASWVSARGIDACRGTCATMDAAADRGPGSAVLPLGSALCIARDHRGRSLHELSQHRPVLLVAVRHFGCTFCRETLADLADRRAALESQGVELAILHSAGAEAAAPHLARHGLGDVPAFADPDQRLARALGIRRGTFIELLGPRNLLRAIPAFFAGHGVGYPVGDPLLMPGAFVIHGGRVRNHHHPAYAGERTDWAALLQGAGLAGGGVPAHT
jgi:hypothetical protein